MEAFDVDSQQLVYVPLTITLQPGRDEKQQEHGQEHFASASASAPVTSARPREAVGTNQSDNALTPGQGQGQGLGMLQQQGPEQGLVSAAPPLLFDRVAPCLLPEHELVKGRRAWGGGGEQYCSRVHY